MPGAARAVPRALRRPPRGPWAPLFVAPVARHCVRRAQPDLVEGWVVKYQKRLERGKEEEIR